MREHDDVVEAALATGATPVPARFGQQFADDDACVAEHRAAGQARCVSARRRAGSRRDDLDPRAVDEADGDELVPLLPEMVDEEPGVGRRYLETLRARETATGTVRQALDALAQALE